MSKSLPRCVWEKKIRDATLLWIAIFCVGGQAALATVLIRDDAGGPVGGYMQRYGLIRDSGEDVVVDGSCLSACTLVLALVPRERICLTRNAVFGFHAAVAQKEWRYPGAGSAGTRVLWELYPEPVRKLIAQKGGLTGRMIYVNASELAKTFSRCHQMR